MAFPLEPEHICADVSALGVSWYATGWNLENCPFIEEIGSENAPGNSPIMFTGPNEPDLAWVMPCEVATRWHDVVEPQYGNYALASPGIAKWNRGWLPLFWECFQSQYGRQPAMAYLAIHCYSTGPDGRDCLAEFTAAAAWGMAHGLETIVSEYAALVHGNPYGCNGGCADCQTEAQGLAEARRVLDGLKRVPGILAVAWYNTRTPGDDPGAMDCNSPLISNDGSLTGFGMLYRDW